MANSLTLDVRYTHSSIMGVYAAYLILLQLFIKSQVKNNGKELLYKIPTQYKAPFQEQSKNSILFTSFSSYTYEAEKRTACGVQCEMSWYLLRVTIKLTSLSSPVKIRHPRKLDTLATGHSFVFPSPHLHPVSLSHPYTTYCLFGKSTQQPPFVLHMS